MPTITNIVTVGTVTPELALQTATELVPYDGGEHPVPLWRLIVTDKAAAAAIPEMEWVAGEPHSYFLERCAANAA